MATAASSRTTSSTSLYRQHVNPQWTKLLSLLRMDVAYSRCAGAELFTTDGDRILDFLSGYCVHNIGHNHPRVIQALHEELDRSGPAMLQSHIPELAGELAHRLCELAGGKLSKVFFCSSGSEGVEAAIKFARSHTRRSGILCVREAFHGLTCGALSLMSNEFWREGFGPLLPDVDFVDFGDLEHAERKLKSGKFAAFILEPIQGEGGIYIPSPQYMQDVERLCRRHGTLFVLDEVQTGMFRTGPFLAAHNFGVKPDMVILAKALSGGLVPSGAVLMSDAIYNSVYGSLKRAIVHTSTFSENGLAMRAGLTTLDVLEDEQLGPRATRLGEYVRQRLHHRLKKYEMYRETRGLGLMSGIEFQPPRKLSLKMSYAAFRAIHPGMFGQMLVMRLFRRERVLTQICGNNFLVLKVAPPLTISEPDLDYFIDAIDRAVADIHTSSAFWNEALGLAKRATI